MVSFLLDYYPPHRNLHSFPTRRSSDLKMTPLQLPATGVVAPPSPLVSPPAASSRIEVNTTFCAAVPLATRPEEQTTEHQPHVKAVCSLTITQDRTVRDAPD